MNIKYCDICGQRADNYLKMTVLTRVKIGDKAACREKLEIHYECLMDILKYLNGVGKGWATLYVDNFDREEQRRMQDWLKEKRDGFNKKVNGNFLIGFDEKWK